MMIPATQLRSGTLIIYNGELHRVHDAADLLDAGVINAGAERERAQDENGAPEAVGRHTSGKAPSHSLRRVRRTSGAVRRTTFPDEVRPAGMPATAHRVAVRALAPVGRRVRGQLAAAAA